MPKGFPDLPPVWAVATALLSWLLAETVPLARIPATSGVVFIGAGVLLIVWAGVWFWRKATPIEPHHDPKALIVEGPFRLNRNPIYTGLALILFGLALRLGALSALLPVLAFPFLITRRFILPEEEALRAAFGAEAARFFQATRRW